MNTPSLREILQLIEGEDIMDMNEEDQRKLMDFVRAIDNAGTESLQSLKNENIVDMILLLKSLVTFVLLSQGDFEEGATMLFSDMDFDKVIAVTLKLSVGLAALEEWH